MTLRHAFDWKSLFYGAGLPALRRIGPARGDAILGALGRLANGRSSQRRRRVEALTRARAAVGADWDIPRASRDLAANAARFLARDYLLDGLSDTEVDARFDVRGEEHLRAALALGRGVVLVGSHLGAHLAGVHWLHRGGFPLRLLVQRPRHVSRTLQNWFDRAGEGSRYPQSAFFLRRHLPPIEASRRLLWAHAALRDGAAVYLSGDIPWRSANARRGRLLGRQLPFLAVWAELAILAAAPVVALFCTHRPGGRYHLTIDPPWHPQRGREAEAVTRYVERLEAEIAAHPADAVAHLTWPCYTGDV